MKKLFALLAGFVVAATAVAVLSGTGNPALASSCTNGTKYTDFDGSRSGNTLTVWPKKKLCNDVKVNFTTFKVLNKNYNGQPFKNNPTALPQASMWNKTVTLQKGSTTKVSVAMQTPDPCTPYQIDAYIGPVQSTITTSAGLKGTTAIVAKLFNKTKTNCNPVVKNIQVCRLSDKAYPVTIKETEFDSKKYSKNPADCKKEELVSACNLKTLKIEQNVPKSKIDNVNYTLDLEKCKPAEKTIIVCRLEDKAYPVTIKESEFDDTKYSKSPADCEAEDKNIEVCRLEDKVYPVTIKESEFDSTKYSMDQADCAEEKCPIPGKEHLPADSENCEEDETPTPVELPKTGPADAFASLVGAGALAGTATTYFKSRRNRQ